MDGLVGIWCSNAGRRAMVGTRDERKKIDTSDAHELASACNTLSPTIWTVAWAFGVARLGAEQWLGHLAKGRKSIEVMRMNWPLHKASRARPYGRALGHLV